VLAVERLLLEEGGIYRVFTNTTEKRDS
jgi:hypothetical protein